MLEGRSLWSLWFQTSNSLHNHRDCTRPAGEVPSLRASPGDSVWGPWSVEIMGETDGPSPKPLQRSYAQLGVRSM